MKSDLVTRDERTLAVENASYKPGFYVMAYGLLVLTAVRGLLFNQASWDLLALAIVGSGVATLYQGQKQILQRGWGLKALGVAVIAAAAAALLAAGLAKLR